MNLLRIFIFSFFTIAVFASTVFAQNNYTIKMDPEIKSMSVGDEFQMLGKVYNDQGEVVSEDIRFLSRSRRSLAIDRNDGMAKAMKPGTIRVTALYVDEDNNRYMEDFKVDILFPPLSSIELINLPDKIYANTAIQLDVRVIDEAGLEREKIELTYKVDGNSAKVDQFGLVEAVRPGNVEITVSADGIQTSKQIQVVENPVASVEVTNEDKEIRTGDVIQIGGKAFNDDGQEVADAPIDYSFIARPDDQLGEAATAQVDQQGRFVANKPGNYTLIAKSGNQISRQTVRVNDRDVQKQIQVVGHALVNHVHTSDLWVWEGVDGRDYAITGTWGGNGEALFWDVTDPANIIPVDTVTVDARTVNDVKISEDGTIGVLTREGASNRRNGIVILDVKDPRNVEIISEYTEGLTGGVHNAFIYEDHIYAVNNGTRYDIINIEDPANPYTVSRFELGTPGQAIHDVWIEDGIAYSSNWSDGIVAVDVGSNPEVNSPDGHEAGLGSPENPVKLAQYSYPSGWNHAAFPFKSETTGDFYVIAGDEAFPTGINVENRPTYPAGWIHFIKFDGWDNPNEVARYEVPEAGTHNKWVDDDVLYVAYYNGGLRIVDISGELMGDLYDQGREIAHFITEHHEGYVPNAAMAWGPQPYKGHIFVADWNSGLWALKLVEKE